MLINFSKLYQPKKQIVVNFLRRQRELQIKDKIQSIIRTFVTFHQLKFLYVFYRRFTPFNHLYIEHISLALIFAQRF